MNPPLDEKQPARADDRADAKPPRKIAGTSIGYLVSIIAFAIFVLTAASLLARFDWRADLLTHFRLQYSFILLATTIALAARRWKKMAAISILGLLLNLYFFAPLYLPAQVSSSVASLADDDAAAELKLMHFNVHTSNTRRDEVASLIRNSGADVVFLQEINAAWLRDLEGKVGPYRLEAVEPRADNFGLGMWVRTSSNLEVEALRITAVKTLDITGGIAQVPALLAVLEIDGHEIQILSLHTLPPISGEYAAVRDRQLAAAAELAQASQVPFVVIGDLNATPWSAQFRKMLDAGDLTDSLRSRGVQVSWPAGIFKLGMIPIDHCLTHGNILVTERGLGDSTGSDHRPLFVTLKVGG